MSSPAIHLQPKSSNSSGSLTPRSSSESTSSSVSFDIVRCSRCQRSLSIENASSPAPGVVQFGMNSYYCSRCASMDLYSDLMRCSFDSLNMWFYSTCHRNQSRTTICSGWGSGNMREFNPTASENRVRNTARNASMTPGAIVEITSTSPSFHNGNGMDKGHV